MYQHMSAEVGRNRQSDVRAAAAHRRMVAEAAGERNSGTTLFHGVANRFRRLRRDAVTPATAPTPALRPAVTPAG